MKFILDMPDFYEVVKTAIENAILEKQIALSEWKFFTLKETASLLQIKTGTLLDKRMPYLNEIEYYQNGKVFWFSKDSVEAFIVNRKINKYKRFS
jgi:hypothetical protein